MRNAAHERHTFHILQRLLEAKNVSVIEDDCPNRRFCGEPWYRDYCLGSICIIGNTRIYCMTSVFVQKRSVRAVVFDYGNVLLPSSKLEDMKGMALVCGSSS